MAMDALKSLGQAMARRLEEEQRQSRREKEHDSDREDALPFYGNGYASASEEALVSVSDTDDKQWLQDLEDVLEDPVLSRQLVSNGSVFDELVEEGLGLPISILRGGTPQKQYVPITLRPPVHTETGAAMETESFQLKITEVQHATIIGCEFKEEIATSTTPVVPVEVKVGCLPGKSLIRALSFADEFEGLMPAETQATEVVDTVLWGQRSETLTMVLAGNDSSLEVFGNQRASLTHKFWERTPLSFCLLLDFALHHPDKQKKVFKVLRNHLSTEFRLKDEMAQEVEKFNRERRQKLSQDIYLEVRRLDGYDKWDPSWHLSFDLVFIILK
jgi:hypothetical protein